MNTIKLTQNNKTIFTELYYEINEFMTIFLPVFEKHLIGSRRQRPFSRLAICEIMTILIGFQIIGGRNFKSYYKDTVVQFHHAEFPSLVSYNRFVEIAQIAMIPMIMFLKFRMEMVKIR